MSDIYFRTGYFALHHLPMCLAPSLRNGFFLYQAEKVVRIILIIRFSFMPRTPILIDDPRPRIPMSNKHTRLLRPGHLRHDTKSQSRQE